MKVCVCVSRGSTESDVCHGCHLSLRQKWGWMAIGNCNHALVQVNSKRLWCVLERVRFRVTALVDISISVIAGCLHPVTNLNRRSQGAMFFGLARLTAFVPKLPLSSPFHFALLFQKVISLWKAWRAPLCQTAFPNFLYIIPLPMFEQNWSLAQRYNLTHTQAHSQIYIVQWLLLRFQNKSRRSSKLGMSSYHMQRSMCCNQERARPDSTSLISSLIDS